MRLPLGPAQKASGLAQRYQLGCQIDRGSGPAGAGFMRVNAKALPGRSIGNLAWRLHGSTAHPFWVSTCPVSVRSSPGGVVYGDKHHPWSGQK
jgi:hypothetical protein